MKPATAVMPLLALASLSCSAPRAAAPPDSAPVRATIATVQLTDVPATFEAGGIVRARVTAPIASRVLAPVLAVHVRAGDSVRRGATLVTLDDREMAANRARASAALSAAEESARAAASDVRSADAAVQLARVTHDRVAALQARRSATQQELDQAVAGLRGAEAQLSAARARADAATAAREAARSGFDAAQVAESYAVLTAPFDGMVTERLVDPGAMALPGAPLLSLDAAPARQLEIRLDEARAAAAAPGQQVEVRIGDTPDCEWVSAPIAETARIDPASHTFLIKVDVPERVRAKAGQYGRARFSGPLRRTLTAPTSAVVRRGQLAFVFQVDADGRARLQPISPAAEIGDRIEILAGLRVDDRVVVDPPPLLADGTRVINGGGE